MNDFDFDDARLDALLRGPGGRGGPRDRPASAPAGFADRVLARVAVTSQDSVSAMFPVAPTPWWVRAAAQPASALALVLAGTATAFAPQLLGVSREAGAWAAALRAALVPALAGGGAGGALRPEPLVLAALAPVLVLASIALYRLGRTLATVRFAPTRSPRA